jgi:hypothetical protein
VVAQRAHAFNHWPDPPGTGSRLGAGARKTSLICYSLELSGELWRFASSSFQASPCFSPALAAGRGAPCGNRVVGHCTSQSDDDAAPLAKPEPIARLNRRFPVMRFETRPSPSAKRKPREICGAISTYSTSSTATVRPERR